MAATKLGIFNDALQILGERALASISENVSSRRDLDSAWDKGAVTDGGPIYCLEQGYWNFGSRASALSYSPSVEPPFGYLRAFDKPTDWVRTVSVAADPYFQFPMTQYNDEAGFWFSDYDILYVKYVSKDASYGMNLAAWPMSFEDFVALYLADSVCERIVQSASMTEKIHKDWKEAKHMANGIDGTNKPTQMIPMGQWAGARQAGWGRRSARWRES